MWLCYDECNKVQYKVKNEWAEIDLHFATFTSYGTLNANEI